MSRIVKIAQTWQYDEMDLTKIREDFLELDQRGMTFYKDTNVISSGKTMFSSDCEDTEELYYEIDGFYRQWEIDSLYDGFNIDGGYVESHRDSLKEYFGKDYERFCEEYTDRKWRVLKVEYFGCTTYIEVELQDDWQPKC